MVLMIEPEILETIFHFYHIETAVAKEDKRDISLFVHCSMLWVSSYSAHSVDGASRENLSCILLGNPKPKMLSGEQNDCFFLYQCSLLNKAPAKMLDFKTKLGLCWVALPKEKIDLLSLDKGQKLAHPNCLAFGYIF